MMRPVNRCSLLTRSGKDWLTEADLAGPQQDKIEKIKLWANL